MLLKKSIIAIALASLTFASCSKHQSYAELLSEEEKAVNYFLANKRVVLDMPDDLKFDTAGGDEEKAPFYRMDEDGMIYMQVLDPGDQENNKAKDDELIYFRYTRYDLKEIMNTGSTTGYGNSSESTVALSFRLNNYTLASSAQYGSGIQVPLQYLGVDCKVNIVIRSQYGFASEVTTVIPYLFSIRYYRSKI